MPTKSKPDVLKCPGWNSLLSARGLQLLHAIFEVFGVANDVAGEQIAKQPLALGQRAAAKILAVEVQQINAQTHNPPLARRSK